MNDYKHKGLGSKSPIISAVNKNVEYFTVRYRYPVTNKLLFIYTVTNTAVIRCYHMTSLLFSG